MTNPNNTYTPLTLIHTLTHTLCYIPTLDRTPIQQVRTARERTCIRCCSCPSP